MLLQHIFVATTTVPHLATCALIWLSSSKPNSNGLVKGSCYYSGSRSISIEFPPEEGTGDESEPSRVASFPHNLGVATPTHLVVKYQLMKTKAEEAHHLRTMWLMVHHRFVYCHLIYRSKRLRH